MQPPTSGPIASAIAETPAQIPIASPALPRRERGGDDRQRRRVHQRRADALDDARTDQTPALFAKPQKNDEAVKITRPTMKMRRRPSMSASLPPGQQEDAERERVAVDDPLELRDRDAEVLADRRQRHVHDRVVEHDHEEPEGDGEERPPLAKLGCKEPRAHET
jgi:hypothetical protein